MSRVLTVPNGPNVESYTGFITVNNRYNSNMFFWFIPCFKNPETAPVLVYLEGGPGTSSLVSLFMWGTFNIDYKLNVTINPWSWNRQLFSIIYVDNPVGTGFSYTNDSDNGYSRDQLTVSQNLYEFLRQFFLVFHDYRKRDLYLGGVSYAGKYVPAFGHYLIQMSNKSNLNFTGILVGNGFTDPINQLAYDKTLLNLGLIDENQAIEVQTKQNQFKQLIKSMDYFKASKLFQQLKIFVDKYLAQQSVRKAIHIGSDGVVYNMTSRLVFRNLFEDITRSAEPNLTALIDNGYKVLLFTGNLDIIVGVESTNGLLLNKNYNRAKRCIWKVNGNDPEIAGYAKSFGNFQHIIVRNAGHFAMLDQPRATLDMANRFIKSLTFD
ncbi:probable serine carboxypeptidase CPVL [Oppia nitens]|uniref:probable serine carboxypeptidase CPVL n=1 Tax=Oppia nitens TaxID=1686743 RepID=UPI0023DB2EF6|nr:probable serine carboxypeptidase CPVL [Oppia nitens]